MHPDYRYTPWSEERRARASLAAKKRIRITRAIELAEGLDRRRRENRELLRLLRELLVLS
jgi:hypothetical protein